jgi:hypothetical protein
VQLVSNERLVRRESRIGGALLGVTFVMLAVGLLLSLNQESWVGSLSSWAPLTVTYAIVIVGMGFYYFGNARIRRYGPRYRQDERLRQLLKGLDDRYVLYTFLSRGLPDYVLLGPSGIFVLTPRFQEGRISCRDDVWSRASSTGRRVLTALYGNPLGRPSHETAQAVQQVQALLQARLAPDTEQPPVSGLIVFTGERVRLDVQRCSVPATTGKELRKIITKLKGKISASQLVRLRSVFDAFVPG